MKKGFKLLKFETLYSFVAVFQLNVSNKRLTNGGTKFNLLKTIQSLHSYQNYFS